MEDGNTSNEQAKSVSEARSNLNTVTPLSKYLAMVLFVILPFLGGWIGYTYAPEKIVEVGVVVTKEAEIIETSPKNEIGQSSTTDKITAECPLDQSGNYVVITNTSSELQRASKAIILKSGISESYLNEHFSFVCGIDYSPTNQRVVWKYTIDEHTAFLEGIINPPERTDPKFTEIVGILHDIQKPLPLATATEKINECLDEEATTIEVKLIGGPMPLGDRLNPETILNNDEGGLFMFGTTEDKRDTIDSSIYRYHSTILNLETGACTTDTHTVVVD